ncbi:PH domain-containing protein [Roseibacillus persicicus]|uniref:PH domain-containing protein n=1 Tax=Roseibacillus persicicus TaxID=454148 RepID=UPI00398B5D8A
MSTEAQTAGWFYVDSQREKQGPYTVLEFKELADQGVILADTLIWSNGYEAWVPARQLAGLVPEQTSSPKETAPPTPPTPEPSPAPADEPEPLPDESHKPRWGSFVFPRLIVGFALSLIPSLIAVIACLALQQPPLIGAAVFLLFAILTVFAALVCYRKERYELTDTTVLRHCGGLMSDQTTEVEICNITHVSMKRPWLRHKLFGIGTIEIESAGTSKPVALKAICDPAGVYERLTVRMQRNGYHLKKKELLHEERPAIRGILVHSFQMVMGTILALIFGSSTLASLHQQLTETGLAWISPIAIGLFAVVALAFFLVYFLDMRRRTYRVFDDAVVYEEGFLTRRSAFIPYENIADAATKRTFLDQVFNIFDVLVSCQGSSTEIKFRGLKEGVQLSDFIEQLVTEANQKPSPPERLAARRSDLEEPAIPSRQEPDLVAPGEAWIADLGMHPTRVFVPLLVLLPIFPLWIVAMIQWAIKMTCTTYEVRAGSIGHSYRFLTSSEREFAYDKITGLVIKENLWDRLFGTFTLRFWSIGSGQSLELAHVHRSLVDLDALLRQIGIPNASEQSRLIPSRFGAFAWMRARLYRLSFSLLATIGLVVAAVLTDESLFYLAAGLFPLLVLVGFAYAWTFYSRQQLIFQDHHIEAAQGIIARKSYFVRYRNVKQNVVTTYPGGTDGSLQIFVAGEQMIGQQSEKKGQQQIPVPCSFTLGFLPDAMKQGQLLDDILGGRVEVTSECEPADPLELVTESTRGLGNAVFFLFLWSLLLVPMILLLPITLPLTILATKRWRYRVEGGRMVASWGLLFKKRASILLDRVDSLEQRQGFLNKMFKNGNVSIMTAGSSKPDLVMVAAKSYKNLYHEIRQLSRKG